MNEKDEYINVTDFLKLCARGLEKNGRCIHNKYFSYSRYACCIELGNELLDFGVNPEKRKCIKECEEKNYIHKNIELSEYPILIDLHLVQILAILNGSHSYITLYSSYFLHHSKVICCDDEFYLEKCFWGFLNIVLPCDDNNLKCFLNNNVEFAKFCKKNKIKLNEKNEKNEKEMNENEYINDLFIFFEIFLICFALGFVIIDSVISRNYLIHRDDYKNASTALVGTLVATCKNNIFFVLKNWQILKKSMLQFIKKMEEKKKNKEFMEILKRLKFITHFITIMLEIEYFSKECGHINKEDNKQDEQKSEHANIQNDCMEAIKCIETIEKVLAETNKTQEKEGENRKEIEEKVASKYFNLYLLMHKVEGSSKYVAKISVEESYAHYKNILKDIHFIDSHYKSIPFHLSYFEITNILFYFTHHSYSSNILSQCIAQLYIQRISKKWKDLFQKKEKALVEELVKFEKESKTHVKNIFDFEQSRQKKPDNITQGNKEYTEKIDNNKDNKSNELQVERNNGSYNFENEKDDNHAESNEDITYYYNMFSTVFNQDYFVNGNDETQNNMEKQMLYQNIKNCIYVNFFFFLFYTEYFDFIELIKQNNTDIFVKNIIYYDLISFGFSADLLILLTHFVYMPETFFFNIEHKLKINLDIPEFSFEKNDSKSFDRFDSNSYSTDVKDIENVKDEPKILCMSKKTNMEKIYFGINDIDMGIHLLTYNKMKERGEKKNEIAMKQFRQRVSTQFQGVISNIQNNEVTSKLEGKSFLCVYQFIEKYNFTDVKIEEETLEESIKETKETKEKKCVKKKENEKTNEDIKEELPTNKKEKIIKNRMKFVLLCKIFDMFYQCLHLVLSRNLYISFLLPARQHSTLIKSEKEIRTLYYLMKGLIDILRLYNLTEEIESIQNYFNCVFQNFQINVMCLSLCIDLPTTHEYAHTYYALSVCLKELSNILLKKKEISNYHLSDKCKLEKEDKTKQNFLSSFYDILLQCCDFLIIYFIYITYTNADLNTFECNIFDLKYGTWKNVYKGFCKLDFLIYNMNKSLLRHALISKTLQIDSSNTTHFFSDPQNKKKIKNLMNIEESYMMSKETLRIFQKYVTYGGIDIEVFPIFKESVTDIDVLSYLKNSIKKIKNDMKHFMKQLENVNNYSVILKILNLFIRHCYVVFDDNTYLDLPKFRIENTDICLNRDFEVLKQHPIFLKIRCSNVALNKKKDNINC